VAQPLGAADADGVPDADCEGEGEGDAEGEPLSRGEADPLPEPVRDAVPLPLPLPAGVALALRLPAPPPGEALPREEEEGLPVAREDAEGEPDAEAEPEPPAMCAGEGDAVPEGAAEAEAEGVADRAAGAKLIDSDDQRLIRLAGSPRHQGVVAKVEALAAVHSLDDVLDAVAGPPLVLVLDGVTDPHNLGACLRVADGAGVHAVVAPKDHAVGLNATVAKVASGAAETVPYLMVTNLARTLNELKDRGIQVVGTAEDAEIAVRHGVEVIYVSNHGGRQLDHGRGSLDVLPEVVQAVAGRARVIFDGGILRGTDILKALALGADAVAVGRLEAMAMAAGGVDAVVRMLELLEIEMQLNLASMGLSSIDQLEASSVVPAQPVGLPSVLSGFPLLEEDY
jgi:hypothetical protein